MEAILLSYWGDRPESLEVCAGRLKQMLDGLAGIDEAFTHWFRGGRTRAESFRPLGRGLEDLTAELTDTEQEHESEGFMGGAWSGQDDGASFDVRGGAWSVSPRVRTTNLANMDFPHFPDYDGSEGLYQPEVMLRVAAEVIGAWRPEILAITTDDWWDAQNEAEKALLPVGWVTWLGGDRAALVPAGVGEPFAGGVLVRAAESFVETTAEATLKVFNQLAPTGALAQI